MKYIGDKIIKALIVCLWENIGSNPIKIANKEHGIE